MSQCSASNLALCITCLSCVNNLGLWYAPDTCGTDSSSGGACVSFSALNPDFLCSPYANSYAYGETSSDCKSCGLNPRAPAICNAYLKLSLFRAQNTQMYTLIGCLVVIIVMWIGNLIAIGVVSRRKGLNPFPYLALAFFFGVWAWICVACTQTRQGAIMENLVPIKEQVRSA
jgi:hypothetical protein